MAEKAVYKVEGLDCGEEVAILKKALGQIPGIIQLDFDVLNARMAVTYEPDKTSPEELIRVVQSTDMMAIPWEKRSEQKTGSFWRRRGRLVMASASAVLLLAGLISHWLLHGGLLDVFLMGESESHVFPMISIALYLAATMAGAWYVMPRAFSAVRRLQPDMNLLMTVAVIGAIVIAEWFEAAVVAFLFALSLLLEQWSVGRARRAIGALLDLSPKTARYRDSRSDEIKEVPVEQVPVGVTVLVRPGEKIPLDGAVTAGSSTVNQAPITGESMPVEKETGDQVYAGTINEAGALEIRATKLAGDTTLSRILHLIEEAQSRRAPAQQWVDRFAYYYTPAMMILAATIAVMPPLVFSASWGDWFYRGLVILVIACPCALVISTPVSIVSTLTAAARNGVLIKGGAYVEAAGRLQAVALDKTGTLTYGRPEVQQVVPFNGHTNRQLLEIAAALEVNSEHPLARAILQKATALDIQLPRAEDFQAVKGKGAHARIDGRVYWIGSHRLMHDKGQETPQVHTRAEELEAHGHTVVAVGNDRHVCGLISIADTVRTSAKEAIRAMKRAGIKKVVMLTGDNVGTARAIGQEIGVDDVRAELLPDDKVAAVRSLVEEYGDVAMAGDGINDAPALATATCGIAMGAMGTDVAIETADIALMSDELEKIAWLIEHSRRTLGIIKQNICFSLGLKLLFIALTLLGLASLWIAIVADTGATLLVVFNGLRLLHTGEKTPVRTADGG